MHSLCMRLGTKYNCVSSSTASHDLSQGSPFPGVMRGLKDRRPRRCFRLNTFAVGVSVVVSLSSYFRFKQLNRLSDPRVEQRVEQIFESTLLQFSNIFEIPLQRKLFPYRNLLSYACQNQWFGNETSVSHDHVQPPLGVVREYVCTYLGIDSLHYSEVWFGVQPRRLFRPLL